MVRLVLLVDQQDAAAEDQLAQDRAGFDARGLAPPQRDFSELHFPFLLAVGSVLYIKLKHTPT
jgi:hypothetical protein